MKKNIVASGIPATPALEEYVHKKVDSLDKFLPVGDESVEAQVEIGKTTHHHQKGDFFRAEINLHMAGKHYLRAEAEAPDLYAAIDAVRDEMAREIKKIKGRGETMFRRGARIVKNILRFGKNTLD